MKLIAADNQRAHRRLPACAHDHDDGRLVGRHVEEFAAVGALPLAVHEAYQVGHRS